MFLQLPNETCRRRGHCCDKDDKLLSEILTEPRMLMCSSWGHPCVIDSTLLSVELTQPFKLNDWSKGKKAPSIGKEQLVLVIWSFLGEMPLLISHFTARWQYCQSSIELEALMADKHLTQWHLVVLSLTAMSIIEMLCTPSHWDKMRMRRSSPKSNRRQDGPGKGSPSKETIFESGDPIRESHSPDVRLILAV